MNSWFLVSVSPAAALSAIVFASLGVGLLYARSRRKVGVLWCWLGWGLIVASSWFWQRALGFDRGIVLALLWPALMALTLIAWGADWRAALQPVVTRTGRLREYGAASWRYRSRRWLLAGPVSFLATTVLAMGWFAHSQWSDANRLVGAALLLVVLWPLAMTWSSSDSRLWRPLAVNVAALALGGGLLLYRTGG